VRFFGEGRVTEQRQDSIDVTSWGDGVPVRIAGLTRWLIDGEEATEDAVIELMEHSKPGWGDPIRERRAREEKERQERAAKAAAYAASHRIKLELVDSADREWSTCDYCDNPAAYSHLYPGCTICGGSDCGDSAYVEYWCEEHAREDSGLELPQREALP